MKGAGDTPWKIGIKPLKETNLGVAQVLFDYSKTVKTLSMNETVK